jgi:hypothetical protein
VIRDTRSPSPAIVEHRRVQVRPRAARTLHYEMPEIHAGIRSPRKTIIVRPRDQYIYAADQPTQVIRTRANVPRLIDSQVPYGKSIANKPQKKYLVRQLPVDTLHDVDYNDDNEDVYVQQHRPQHIQVVQKRYAAPSVVTNTQRGTKYVMLRRRADAEPIYTVQSSVPVVKGNRRIVYSNPVEDSTTKYVYSTDRKFDK